MFKYSARDPTRWQFFKNVGSEILCAFSPTMAAFKAVGSKQKQPHEEEFFKSRGAEKRVPPKKQSHEEATFRLKSAKKTAPRGKLFRSRGAEKNSPHEEEAFQISWGRKRSAQKNSPTRKKFSNLVGQSPLKSPSLDHLVGPKRHTADYSYSLCHSIGGRISLSPSMKVLS